MTAEVSFARSQAFLEVVRCLVTSGPCPISSLEQCEISASASREKELHVSKARDSSSHLDTVSGILKDRTKLLGKKRNLETLQRKEKQKIKYEDESVSLTGIQVLSALSN